MSDHLSEPGVSHEANPVVVAPAGGLFEHDARTHDQLPPSRPTASTSARATMVTQEMVAQLKPGMTREQVRFILGTPLVADMFHADRWDYVYRFQPGRGEIQQRRFDRLLSGQQAARVAGDVVVAEPGETEAAATSADGAPRVIRAAAGRRPRRATSRRMPRPSPRARRHPARRSEQGRASCPAHGKRSRTISPLPAAPAAWAAR
jgi:outer membrane protein assembly factor BamE (lipoprotein component of BamABCDE complex)